MGRRRDDSILDDLFAILLLAPWWLGPILAGMAYAGCTWVVPWFLTASAPDNPVHSLPSKVFSGAAPLVAQWIAGVMLFVWIVAEFKKLSQRKLLDRQNGIDSIRSLSWQDFERLLAEAFRREGYVVVHVGQAGPDGGIDLHLRKNGSVTLVQCKHWRTQQVGVRIVRELLGVVASEKADSGILVTSGVFTGEALAFAEKNSIRLIDGEELSSLIQGLQPTPKPEFAVTTPQNLADSQQTRPTCPLCQSPMVQRTASRGRNRGSQFWGCSQYPRCKGTRNIAVVN